MLMTCRSFCSYTCTKDGVQQLVTATGAYDRWAEALAEASYGALSLIQDPQVTVSCLESAQRQEHGPSPWSYPWLDEGDQVH